MRPSAERAGARTIVLVAVVAVVARLAAQILAGFYSHPELYEYDAIARSIAAGEGYRYAHNGTIYLSFAEPLFTFMLASVYAVFGQGSIVAIGLLLACLGALLSVLAVGVGTRSGGPVVGALAGLATALHPGLVVYAAKVHSLTLDAILVLVAFLALIRLVERPGWGSGLILGCVSAACALERATFLAFVLAGGIAALVIHRGRSGTLLRPLVLAGLVTIVGALPWIVRNELVLGAPAITTSGGEVLWRGNNPQASGGSLTRDGVPILDASPAMRDRVWGMPELEQDRIFTEEAIAYITADPARTARDDAAKLLAFWWFTDRSGQLYPAGWLLPYQVYYVALLTLSLGGTFTLARRRAWRPLVVTFLAFATISASHAIVYVEGRHRWVVEPLMIMLAAVAIAEVARSVRGNIRPAVKAAGA